MIEFANILFLVICVYIASSFAILMLRVGRQWQWFNVALGMFLIALSVGLRAFYATLTRMFSPEGAPYDPWFDEHRGAFYLAFAGIFFIGGFIFDYELRNARVYRHQFVIWGGVLLSAIVLYLV